MSTPKLTVVTASTNLARALPCIKSWMACAQQPFFLVVVTNGAGAAPEGVAALHPDDWPLAWFHSPEYLGTVPAFRKGTEIALEIAAQAQDEIVAIAALHDDLEIHEPNWDQKVLKHFQHHPACGLLGFGGAIGLGAADIYQTPYDPMQLARVGFRSNLVDAEVHGIRALRPERCAALDGFSQVGRTEFWQGHSRSTRIADPTPFRPWQVLENLGLIHHFQDGALACLADRYAWET